MKDFLKYVLATMVGLVLMGALMFILGMMSLVGMVASGESKQNVSDNSVLVLNLSGEISEQATDDPFAALSGNDSKAPGLDAILSALEKAKTNDHIKGIYMEADGVAAPYATLSAIRRALADFKKSGKWIVAYGDSYSQSDYYLASVANTIYINPQGMLDWHGLAAQPMFLTDALKQFGVKYQVVKVGTFKSATEVYTETQMSPANREQYTRFLQGTWDNVCKDVAASRKLTVEQLNAYADSLIVFASAEDYVKQKLVDKLIYANEVKAEVKKLLKLDADATINQVSVAQMKNVKGDKKKGEEVAIYYAYGDIVDEPAQGLLGGGTRMIVGKDMTADLEELMNDDDVKAVVLRVNSPGGSAYASEQIWHQIMQLKEKKPVVVSMGDYAASGGYYISCPANWIVAEPNTLTGSIGIFAAIPNYSELATKKLQLHFDEVKTNRHAAFGNIAAREMNSEELAFLQAHVNRGYALFRKRVADGRKQPVEEIEKIAQGRVWLGQDALGLKLVDQLGSLDDAVKKAAALAKLSEYHTKDYPAAPDWTDQIFAMTDNSGNYLDEQLQLLLGDLYEPFVFAKRTKGQAAVQARLPYLFDVK